MGRQLCKLFDFDFADATGTQIGMKARHYVN